MGDEKEKLIKLIIETDDIDLIVWMTGVLKASQVTESETQALSQSC